MLIVLTLLILGSINIIQGSSYNKDINHYQNKVDKLKAQAQKLNAKSEENYKKLIAKVFQIKLVLNVVNQL